MINIKTYKQYWTDMVARIEGLEDSRMVANEAQLKNVLTGSPQYPILIFTIPSADPSSRDSDNVKEKNSGLLFVLTKMAASDRNDESYTDEIEILQNITKEIKQKMTDDFTNCIEPMTQLDVNSFHQDPEYNYLGHDGWSLSFKFDTVGY